MPLHQLRATQSRPDVDHLIELRDRVGAYEALPLLAGHHQGRHGAAPWRTELIATPAPHVFPLPADVPTLLDALFAAIERLFAAGADEEDDVRVAVFAAFGVTAIHPFDNGNGRTALDFAQLLLMHRWVRRAPPFLFPPDAHQRLGPLLARADEVSDSPDPARLVALAARLQQRFSTQRLEELRASPLESVVVAIRALRL